MSDDIDPDRKFSNGTDWDNSIDWDDASDGSDGGYDRHGSPINANAMKELVQLRMETSHLRADLAAVTEERDRLREVIKGINAMLEISCETLERPTYDSLEVGQRHDPLSQKEIIQRLTETCLFVRADLSKLMDEARAALEGVTEAASPWRDIESAPRDGSVFLAINNRVGPDPKPKGYNPYFLCFCLPPDEGVTYASDAGWRSPGRDWPVYPTDWMPIPIPIPPSNTQTGER